LTHPTVWSQYTNVTDRQTDRQKRQQFNRIGRTVLQTVAQKLVMWRSLIQTILMCSPMVSERLTTLALLHIHSHICPDVSKVINDFDTTGPSSNCL